MNTMKVTGKVKIQYIQNLDVMVFGWSHLSVGMANSAAKYVPGRNTIVTIAIFFIA